MQPQQTIDQHLLARLSRQLRTALPTSALPSRQLRDAAAQVAASHAAVALAARPDHGDPRQMFETTLDGLVNQLAQRDSDVADVDADDIVGATATAMGQLAALEADTADVVLALFAEHADCWVPTWVPPRTRRLVAYAVRTGPVEVSHASSGRFSTELSIIALTAAAAVALDGPARPELAWPATPGTLAASLETYPRAAAAAAALRDLERSDVCGVAPPCDRVGKKSVSRRPIRALWSAPGLQPRKRPGSGSGCGVAGGMWSAPGLWPRDRPGVGDRCGLREWVDDSRRPGLGGTTAAHRSRTGQQPP